LVEQSGDFKPSGESRLVQRYRYDSLFQDDLSDGDYIWVYSSTGATDEDIKQLYKAEAPAALGVNSLLQHFPRHRWTGAKEIFQAVLLLAGTHKLLLRCGCKWLLITIEVPRWPAFRVRAAEVAIADADVEADAESLPDEEEAPQIAPLQDNSAQGEHVTDHSTKSAMFFAGERKKAKVFIKSDPLGTATACSQMQACLDDMQRHKLYVSGAKWSEENDRQTALGKPRTYRILDARSNCAERRCANKLFRLLCVPDAWKCLHSSRWTLRLRHLCFRLIARQAAGILMYLWSPHEETPYVSFDILSGDPERIKELSEMWPCKMCDFTFFHWEKYPTADELGGAESLFTFAGIAELLRIATSTVECGHSFWQREARLRSVQTYCETFADCSATVLHMQSRRCEKNSEITSAPKRVWGKTEASEEGARTERRNQENEQGALQSKVRRGLVMGSLRVRPCDREG
jgi:hypothetical protein